MNTPTVNQMKGLVDTTRGLLDRQIFSSQEIYQQELERIFARCWLYLGHESQIAKPGDYMNVMMGEESVLVTRDAGGLLIIGPARVEETASMLEERENIRQFDEAARAARGV